ncbi:MAG: zinc ribbon domain-containing protein [Chloroflexi bacterium]|nr:MAG: zinc ribbon domain-containing protein [Chloroflexota bacterium]
MPIYEYLCLDCDKKFEIIRPISQSDAPLKCAKCGGERVKRSIAVFYAMSGGHSVAGTGGGCDCGSCSGGNCSSCSH